MADEHEQRARETDRLFQGLPARGEVFDSLDDIGSLDPPAPVTPSPPVEPQAPIDDAAPPPAPIAIADDGPAAPVKPAAGGTVAPEDEPTRHDRPAPHHKSAPHQESTPNDGLIDDGLIDDAPVRAGTSSPADRSASLAPARPPAPPWRARAVTVVATILVIAGAFLVIFPFDVTDGGVTARCGPPVFEVLVPSDAAFDVPENTLCGPPAQHRLAVGALALAAFLVLAVVHQWSARSRKRQARRARRRGARARRHGTGPPPTSGGPERTPGRTSGPTSGRRPPDAVPSATAPNGERAAEPVPR